MKLLEILLENEAETTSDGEVAPAAATTAAVAARVPNSLDVLLGNFGIASQTSHTDGQAQEIKHYLSRHTLVTGYRDNEPQYGGQAYIGPIDDNWGNDLSQAILRWKRSVNLQIEFADLDIRPLDVAGPGVINEGDIRFLRANLNNDGTIRFSGLPRRSQRTNAPPFSENNYVPELASPTGAGIETVEQMVRDGIGWSGWYRLAIAVFELMGGDMTSNQDKNAFAVPFIEEVYKHFNRYNAEPWIENWNTRCLGNQRRVVFDTNLRVDIRDNPREIYEKFAPVLERLWQEDLDRRADAASENEAGRSGELTITNPENLTAIATALHEAMDGPGTDEEAIGEQMALLRSTADWEAVSLEYNRLFSKTLHEELYSELASGVSGDLNDYTAYVSSNLMRIRRINHLLLHSMLNFGTEDSIEVQIDGTSYQIQRERVDGKVVIQGYSEHDDIIIDSILRAGLEAQGTEVPSNLEVETTADQRNNAKSAFLAAIEMEYPELSAWYAFADPFNDPEKNPGLADIGGARLNGIVSQSAQMLAVGSGFDAVINFIKQEISSDRAWLIGTGEDNPGVANITFAPQYGAEGSGTRWLPEASPGSDITLDEEEEQLLEALLGGVDNEIDQAVSTILSGSDKIERYIRLYDVAADQRGKYLDSELGNDDTILNHLKDRQDDNSVIMRFVRQLRTPVAAPREMAKLFVKAAEGDEYFWGLFTAGTDDDLMAILINNIRGLSDYNRVDYRYRELSSSNNSLLEDMGDEEWIQSFGDSYYNQLAARIGRQQIDTVLAQVSSRLRTAINAAGENLTEDTLDALEAAIRAEGTITLDKIRPIVRALQAVVETHTPAGDATPPAELPRLIGIRNAFAVYDNEVDGDEERANRSGAMVLQGTDNDLPTGYTLDNQRLDDTPPEEFDFGPMP